MITKIGYVSGPRSPSIHLGAACPQMISTCLTAPNKAGDVREQTREILEIIDGHLRDQGSSREKVMMAQVWLADMGDFAGFRDAWNEWSLPEHPPALSVVTAAASRRDSLVEIRVYAAP
jgi:enamine deaminase RidA (YjgF/YER057c/UK114 family)